MEKSKIVVLGSANYDTFISVDRAPEEGETISASSLKTACGGKGANQAAVLGKLRYNVDFICQIGKDSSGDIIFNELKSYGVNLEHSKVHYTETTGQAFILSYKNGDNSIVIVGGANMNWKDNDLVGVTNALENCKFLNN